MWLKHISILMEKPLWAQKQLGYLPLLFVILTLVHGCLTNNAASMRTTTSSRFLLSASLHSREVASHGKNTGASMKTNAVLPDLVGTLCRSTACHPRSPLHCGCCITQPCDKREGPNAALLCIPSCRRTLDPRAGPNDTFLPNATPLVVATRALRLSWV